jgi:hypothetical protein
MGGSETGRSVFGGCAASVVIAFQVAWSDHVLLVCHEVMGHGYSWIHAIIA